MLTRRQLLLSAGALGAAAQTAGALLLPLPAPGPRALRLGILQSAEPFIDMQDLAGSRQRAFAAFRVLLQNSIESQAPLDWLAAGAFPLSGPGPFPSPVLAQLALNGQSHEVAWLAAFARRHRVQLTLGAWWQATGPASQARLLLFEEDGSWQAARTSAFMGAAAPQGVSLQLCESPFSEPGALAARCRQLGVYGARIEPARSPATPPPIGGPFGGGSGIFAPDGNLMVRATTPGETCIVARLAA